MNQQLIDYTVRNITTGDDEDTRVLDLSDDDVSDFPDEVRDEIRSLLSAAHDSYYGGNSLETRVSWGEASEHIRQLLLPYISDRALYDADYEAWEECVLSELCMFTMPDGHACMQPGYPRCAEHTLCPECGALGEHEYDCPRVARP